MIADSLFQGSSIPVLEQVVQFTQRRHEILAGNVANLDTPGYRVRDLSQGEFESRLQRAIDQRDQTQSTRSLGNASSDTGNPLNEVSDDFERMLYHDESNVSLEEQTREILKNQGRHNMAITIMVSQFELLQAAISERV